MSEIKVTSGHWEGDEDQTITVHYVPHTTQIVIEATYDDGIRFGCSISMPIAQFLSELGISRPVELTPHPSLS